MSLGVVLLFSGLAGVAIPVGSGLAYLESSLVGGEPHSLHGAVIAFGGGVFVAAVAFVLVPEGLLLVPVVEAAVAFALGTGAIMLVDHILAVYAGKRGKMLAMLTDFVPETIAFGALFGGQAGGPLFAVLIALQNLAESYSSFLELREGGSSSAGAWGRLAPLALLGPLGAMVGFIVLEDRPRAVGGLALFAAGGIVYLVFQDIAPDAFKEGDWRTAAAASLGFLVALVGHAAWG